jgi:hypothetical protein
MRFYTPTAQAATDVDLPQSVLQRLSCGLFRCPLPLAYDLMPELSALYDSAPVLKPDDWELDVKIHMLMRDQYPCIPNWHCDNVPRGRDGRVSYREATSVVPKMLLWVSDGPETEFLDAPLDFPGVPAGHQELAEFIRTSGAGFSKIRPQTWMGMGMRTPHRGTQAQKDGWRVFARLTHRSIAPDRPVLSYERRHCQVYLDATAFEW